MCVCAYCTYAFLGALKVCLASFSLSEACLRSPSRPREKLTPKILFPNSQDSCPLFPKLYSKCSCMSEFKSTVSTQTQHMTQNKLLDNCTCSSPKGLLALVLFNIHSIFLVSFNLKPQFTYM